MVTDRVRAVLDDLTSAKDQELERLRASPRSPASTPNPLGLRFAIGARVLDIATGLGGVVTRTLAAAETGRGYYSVRLDDGRLVFRVDSELEPHPVPVLPFGK